jgi:hypothetical protein
MSRSREEARGAGGQEVLGVPLGPRELGQVSLCTSTCCFWEVAGYALPEQWFLESDKVGSNQALLLTSSLGWWVRRPFPSPGSLICWGNCSSDIEGGGNRSERVNSFST